MYEVDYVINGVEHGFALDEAGAVLEESVEITRNELPKAVVDAVMKKFDQFSFEELERITAGGRTVYEVSVELPNNVQHELIVSETGEVLVNAIDK